MIKSRFAGLRMPQNDQNSPELNEGFDPSIQTEKVAFNSSQMVECTSCERRNPPNRLACLYCGSMLDVERIEVSTVNRVIRRPEPWEPAISLVSVPSSKQEQLDIAAAAGLLTLEPFELQSILDAGIPLPLCRLEGEKEAVAVKHLLASLGIGSTLVTDHSLSPTEPPVRLAGMSFADEELILTTFNSRKDVALPSSEIVLLIEGVIAVSRIDQSEKRKGGNSLLQERTATVFDEPLLDIYSSRDKVGFRITTSGFDFSCLGPQKGLLAAENLKALTSHLETVCLNARTIRQYSSLRGPIGRVWEVELRRETKGLQVTGFGKREIGSVLSTSNLEQFTKFSRLQRILL